MTHELKPKAIICVECGEPFVFDVGEQLFFADKGLAEPKRCPRCRAERKRLLMDYRRSKRLHEENSHGEA